MNQLRTRFNVLLSTVLSVSMLFLAAEATLAQGASGKTPGQSAHAPGKSRNLGHNNASNGVKGMIQANKQIFYTGDPLEISIRFPRGAELISSGTVDAFLLIFDPEAETQVVPISDLASESSRKLFQIGAVDPVTLQEGVYQLGLVLTVPDGDPLNMDDWYNGLLGLIAVQGLTMSDRALDIDLNGDGAVDDDRNGDGFANDEALEEETAEEETVEEETVEEEPLEEEPLEETATEEETEA